MNAEARRCPPKVSVVIPVYNREQFIVQTIESVLSQTYQNFELLLVDDGSHDKSPEIMRQYVARSPEKITYLEHPNHQNCGVSASRNLGIRQAKGEYVAFLDSDDVWLPEKLKIQVEILDTYPDVGLVYCPIAFIDEQENPTDKMYGTYVFGNGTPNKPDNAFQRIFSRSTALALASGALIRKSVLLHVGLFDLHLEYQYEDELLGGKIAYLYPIFFYPEPLVKFRIHANNVTWKLMAHEKWKQVEYLVMLRIFQWLKQTAPESNVSVFRRELALLACQAYQGGVITRWSLSKLLLRMFPWYSVDLHNLKLFIKILVGELPGAK